MKYIIVLSVLVLLAGALNAADEQSSAIKIDFLRMKRQPCREYQIEKG